MGAQLVSEALLFACPVLERNHRARVALLAMSVRALDNDEPPVYFASYFPIARALGLAGSEQSKREAVSRVWAQLAAAGIIRRSGPQRRGREVHTARWVLLRDEWPHLAGPVTGSSQRPGDA